MAAADAMTGPRDHGNLPIKHFAHTYEASLWLELWPDPAVGDLG
jgi:hypothetical protein